MPTSSKKVLIVEDDEIINRMLAFLFEHEGHYVKVAKNGIDALHALDEVVPDVIILDIKMPEMDGFEFYKRIKSNPIYEDIPVIIQTALTEETHFERLEALGANNYLQKPFSIEAIRERVYSVI